MVPKPSQTTSNYLKPHQTPSNSFKQKFLLMGKRNTVFYAIGFYLAKVCWLLFFYKLGVLLADTTIFSENSLENHGFMLGEHISTFLIVYVSLIFIGIV